MVSLSRILQTSFEVEPGNSTISTYDELDLLDSARKSAAESSKAEGRAFRQ